LLAALFSSGDLDAFPAAACALEIALLDLAGRVAGRPLSAFLGSGRGASPVYSAVLPLTNSDQFQDFLDNVQELGLSQVKVKVGRDDDLERVGLVRKTLGPQVRLRVDANGAWSSQEAVEKITALNEFKIEAVEQPVPKDDIEGLEHVTRRVQPLVMADESVCTSSQALRLIKRGAVGGFNLRLSKCGGPARTLDLYRLAREAGLSCQLGCHIGELGLLSAAGRHLAEAKRDFIYLEGSLTRFILGRDIISQDLSFGYGGRAPSLPGPGLGVGVIESSLADSHLYTVP